MEDINLNSSSGIFAVTSTSAVKAIPAKCLASKFISIYNEGPNKAFVESGISTTVSVFPTTSVEQDGTIVAAGERATVPINSTATHIIGICAAGETATLYVQYGNGY